MISIHKNYEIINEDRTGGQMLSFISGLNGDKSNAYDNLSSLAGRKMKRNPADSNKILRNAPLAGSFVNAGDKQELSTIKEKIKQHISSKKAHELEELEQKLKKSIEISEKELKQLCRLEKELEQSFDGDKLKELRQTASEMA